MGDWGNPSIFHSQASLLCQNIFSTHLPSPNYNPVRPSLHYNMTTNLSVIPCVCQLCHVSTIGQTNRTISKTYQAIHEHTKHLDTATPFNHSTSYSSIFITIIIQTSTKGILNRVRFPTLIPYSSISIGLLCLYPWIMNLS